MNQTSLNGATVAQRGKRPRINYRVPSLQHPGLLMKVFSLLLLQALCSTYGFPIHTTRDTLERSSLPHRRPIRRLETNHYTKELDNQLQHRRYMALHSGWNPSIQRNSFYLTRIVFVRALAFVYGVAFLVAKHQAKALIGDNGISPSRHILDQAEARGAVTASRRAKWLNSTMADRPIVYNGINPLKKVWNLPKVQKVRRSIARHPKTNYCRERLWDRNDGMGRPVTTILWLAKDRGKLDAWLDSISTCGIALSLLVFLLGAANAPILLALWVCQRSLMAVGGPFWGYGWEPQLAELGFHALFLCPLWSLSQICTASPSSHIVLFAIRWHLFRVMLGAGLIKLKSQDKKWKWPHLSAMSYFFETQPVPNPISRYFHWAPAIWHKGEVLFNHFVELIVPWGLLFPATRRTAAIIQILFQAVLITSGNLSFLNWLTAVPAIACLDDAFLAPLFPESYNMKAVDAAWAGLTAPLRIWVSRLFGAFVAYLSLPVVRNLLARRQVMNASFGPLRLINTYGAFGVVDEERMEYVISGATDMSGPWKEYEFKVKPGNVWRQPRFISPYHYRLDWQLWIASTMRNLQYSPWIYNFLLKLLERDPKVVGLLDEDPFQESPVPPKYIRIDQYRYRFHKQDKDSDERQPYWTRDLVGPVFPTQGVADKDILSKIVEAQSKS